MDILLALINVFAYRKLLFYFLYIYNIYASTSIKVLYIKMYAGKADASCMPKEYRCIMMNSSLRMKVLLAFSHAPVDVDHPFASDDVNAALQSISTNTYYWKSIHDILLLMRSIWMNKASETLLLIGVSMTETLEQTLTAYDAWPDRQPLVAKTRTAYRFQVHQYGAYLAQRPPTTDDPLRTSFVRDYVIRDYKTYLKTERQAKPTSVNLALIEY